MLVLDPRTVNITWQPPPEDQRNGLIQSYVVVVSEVAQDADAEHTLDTEELSAVVGGLHPYRLYNCKVAAVTSAGRGVFNTTTKRLPEDGKV